MTEFELLVIPVSIILGVGVTQILSGFIRAIRLRRSAALHWFPIAWASVILLYCVGYFNVLYDLDLTGTTWGWQIYGPVLFQTVLLFLSAGLIFPDQRESAGGGLLFDFQNHGRLALIPLGLLNLTAPVLNFIEFGSSSPTLVNVFNLVLSAAMVGVLATKRPQVQVAASTSYWLLSIYAWLFVWSRPGDL